VEIIVIDYESFWSSDYTLSDLSTTDYIRDPRFDFHGASILRQADGFKGYYVEKPELGDALAELPWDDALMVSHHAHFDGALTSWKFGHVPKRYFCTLTAARMWHRGETKHSLDALSEFYGIETKSDILKRTKGRHLEEFTADERAEMAEYAIKDAKKCLLFACKLMPKLTERELQIIDQTIRMYTTPKLRVNVPLAKEALADAQAAKAGMLLKYDVKDLRSAKKFAALLEKAGVEPPTKISPKTGKTTFAFAKKDEDFLELQEHPSQVVRDLIEAKMNASSNIHVSRAERFIRYGEGGPLPVYLHCAGAFPWRDSGGDKNNTQNIPRGSKLRKSICAPPEYQLGVVDSSQIEVRMGAELAGQEDLLDMFRNKVDPYNDLATKIYGYEINRALPEHEVQGRVGKEGRLGLQFRMGAKKFDSTLRTKNPPIIIPYEDVERAVWVYRDDSRKIVEFWSYLDEMIRFLAYGKGQVQYKYLTFDADTKRVWGPTGNSLYYYDLHETDNREFVYQARNGAYKYIHGGVMMQNFCEWLCRELLMGWALEIGERYFVPFRTHDELGALIPDAEAQEGFEWVKSVVKKPAAWCPDLPLNCSGAIAPFYNKE
jgi:DNA polymerase III epsilon subunit-like protein